MDRDALREKIRTYLSNEFGLDRDFPASAPVFSSNVLDSLNSVQILIYLETELSRKISPLDVSLDDFDTIDRIVDTMERLA